jgi:DTW domain-containing protein YfiP
MLLAMESDTTFKTNEEVPRSGLYRISHTKHPMRDIRLLKGKTFPACPQCSSAIQFALISAIQMESAGARFRLLMQDEREHYFC